MPLIIRNTILIPSFFVKLRRNLKRQDLFLLNNVSPMLDASKIDNDGTLTPKDFSKINKYYGLAVPAILGEAFCLLRNTSMSNSERWVSTSQGVITGLFDDFFDDLRLPLEDIIEMLHNPKSIIPKSSNQKLFLEFYIIALDKSKDPELIIKQFVEVYKAQVQSLEQEKSSLENIRIWDITKLKGGHSVLFYRTGFDNLLGIGEKEALFQLGVVMQFENDIFDIYKDFKSKISTIPTKCDDIKNLRLRYESEIGKFIELSYKMNYKRKQILKFLDIVMPVINRGFVCLDQYQKLQDINNGVFNIDSFTRKQIICDMEKPKNILKTIYYQSVNAY